jgi:hypothetical protein
LRSLDRLKRYDRVKWYRIRTPNWAIARLEEGGEKTLETQKKKLGTLSTI